ncbi:MAG: hypothetical protein H7246_03780, partial [Phycisphaerae bacterium]|nr:hypothetical protein [Saprospiraceae bacterium]
IAPLVLEQTNTFTIFGREILLSSEYLDIFGNEEYPVVVLRVAKSKDLLEVWNALLLQTESFLMSCGIIDTKEYFNEIISNNDILKFDLENLFNEIEDPQLSELWKSYRNLLNLLPTGIELDEIPKKYGDLTNLLSNTKENNSLYGIVKDVFSFMRMPDDEQSKYYKSLRNSAVVDLGINTDHKSWGNAFDYLNALFEKKKIDKPFQEIIDNALYSSKKKEEVSRFEYFINTYISLDAFGYYRDKKMSNLIDDATHAYYGAYCDFFITEDDNTYNKAKSIYSKFNISTKVCKAHEFIPVFYSNAYINPQSKGQELIDEVIYLLSTTFLLEGRFDDEMNYVNIYKIEKLLLDYFNRMQVNQYEDSNCLFFYKNGKNYSNFYFWIEVESIVLRLFENLGIDLNERSELTELDKDEINKGEWKGRVWGSEKFNIIFYEHSKPFDWTLKIETFKNK